MLLLEEEEGTERESMDCKIRRGVPRSKTTTTTDGGQEQRWEDRSVFRWNIFSLSASVGRSLSWSPLLKGTKAEQNERFSLWHKSHFRSKSEANGRERKQSMNIYQKGERRRNMECSLLFLPSAHIPVNHGVDSFSLLFPSPDHVFTRIQL